MMLSNGRSEGPALVDVFAGRTAARQQRRRRQREMMLAEREARLDLAGRIEARYRTLSWMHCRHEDRFPPCVDCLSTDVPAPWSRLWERDGAFVDVRRDYSEIRGFGGGALVLSMDPDDTVTLIRGTGLEHVATRWEWIGYGNDVILGLPAKAHPRSLTPLKEDPRPEAGKQPGEVSDR